MTRPAHRPPLPPDQRRTRRIEVALTDAEAAKLAAIAAACGKAQAEVLRDGALCFHPNPNPDSPSEPKSD